MKNKPVIGISECLTGAAVRFDGGHKRMDFVMNSLAPWVTYKTICPEVAIGLPVPRPALRLIQTTSGDIRMRYSHAPYDDITDKMNAFADRFLPTMGELGGIYCVCKIAQLRNGACSPV
ncbi:pathogenicity island protein [Salmonella enterica subsp. arizonae]|uniref:Pathogenicity island protein n=1 Tax=Salmonella enterica subsp. arizonae TaxID=59203 RepID=A0A379SHZ6_SALER|nr:pathogenicity island protein [Salmonella enterica subsp. arizonae]